MHDVRIVKGSVRCRLEIATYPVIRTMTPKGTPAILLVPKTNANATTKKVAMMAANVTRTFWPRSRRRYR
jgi:hypothetical protein